jgi:hypothetical protein
LSVIIGLLPLAMLKKHDISNELWYKKTGITSGKTKKNLALQVEKPKKLGITGAVVTIYMLLYFKRHYWVGPHRRPNCFLFSLSVNSDKVWTANCVYAVDCRVLSLSPVNFGLSPGILVQCLSAINNCHSHNLLAGIPACCLSAAGTHRCLAV